MFTDCHQAGGCGIRLMSGPTSIRDFVGRGESRLAPISRRPLRGRYRGGSSRLPAWANRLWGGMRWSSRPVVDPGSTSRLHDFITAVGFDPVVSDFSAFPVDLVSQVIELIATVEPKQGVVAGWPC